MNMLNEMYHPRTTKLHSKYGKLGSHDHFLDKATDALSVIKISNSVLKSKLGGKTPDAKTAAAFQMIDNAVLKIEAFLDSTKNKPSASAVDLDHSTKTIKKKRFPLAELLRMSVPKNVPASVKINLPQNNFDVYGDFYKLVVVITNLIQNSIDAMKLSGVINIISRELADSIVIEVKDSGPGIPREILDKVFSTLYTTKKDGSGLGLKMAKTIIESHGGTISVRNNPTTFSIKLPKE